jgi:acyl-coenzyme A synthetase/AMP-(fatty) acid ligase
MFFHYAHILGMAFPLRAGAAVVLFPERTTASLIFELIENHKPSILVNIPTMMRKMLQTPEEERGVLSSLRLNFSAGEALSGQLYDDWMKTYGVKIVDNIGSAEAYLPYLVRYPDEEVPQGSVGRVCPGVEVKIVDKEANEVPKGETGVLWVHTDAAGQYYVREHEKSKLTFVGDDWVNTNDLFREDEQGFFWYCGRADDMVKVSGVFVSTLEIETCLQTHPSVKECAVLGLTDSDGLTKTKAFVALKAGVEPCEKIADELKAYCKKELASYKSPKLVEFMSELPKTGYGKLDRRHIHPRGYRCNALICGWNI